MSFPLIVTMMFLLLFTGYGCNDQEDFKQESGLNIPSKTDYLKYVHKQLTDQQHITTRSGDYSTSESIDFLNEGLNFMYCRPDTFYAESLYFLDSINLPLNGSGRVEEVDLEGALEDIAIFAGDHFHAEARGDKIPVMFHVRQLVLSPSQLRVEATFVMEAGANSLTSDIYPYEEEWLFGQYGEDVSEECNELEINADAADLFRRDLRKALTYRIKGGPAYYFKNHYTTCFSPSSNNCFAQEISIRFLPANHTLETWELINEEDDPQYDNFYEYYLFYNNSSNSNYHDCLNQDEMNFHYDAMKKLVGDLLPSIPGNSVISQIEVGYELIPSGTTTIFHSMAAVRSTKVPILDQEFQVALELP